MLFLRSLIASGFLAGVLVAQCPPGVQQSFDSATLGTPSCGNPNAGTLPPGWTDGGGAAPWRVWTGTTPSAGTGPSSDHTSGSGNYMFCEASGCSAITHYLLSPCVDTTIGAPTASFWYHLFGTAVGSFEVQEADGMGGWSTVFGPLSGNQGDMWIQGNATLTARANAQVRFVFVTSNSFSSDGALDDVVIGTPAADWELNSPGSSVDINGVQAGGPFGPAAMVGACVNETLTANLASTNTGLPWEVAIAAGPLRPSSAGGILTPNGQVVNVDAFGPTTVWLNGAASGTPFAPNLTIPWPGNFSIMFSAGATGPATASFQQINASPSHPDGFELSQGVQLDVFPLPSFPIPLMLGDDDSATVDLGCPLVPFFGTLYSRLFVSSNGRVLFGGPDPDWEPTMPKITSDNPFAGFWTDLSPQAGGSVAVTEPSPGVISVDYTNIQYYLEPGPASSWSILFDTNTGSITLDNLQGIVNNPQINTSSSTGDAQFLGITLGNLGGTDPGTTPFTVGGSGVQGLATDALYDWHAAAAGRCASLVSGVNQIQFLPVMSGYVWLAN